ncbi:MAG: [FeFe] hydrogenase H-cluster radical SAM maturase HydE [Syntrophales bacterium]|nr:[FeFe] hydrogenase H-cluster radical SAM maturase HydE [Syntrophales bacterium]
MLTKQEIIDLLKEKDPSVIQNLLEKADRIRRENVGDAIHLRALIEFSNYCRRNCLYCGLRRSNDRIVRYRMTMAEIAAVVKQAADLGFGTVVLQSGEDPAYAVDDICALVKNIKLSTGLAVTLCIGERSYDDYRRLKEAGTDRYLLKFETSDPLLFRYLKPDSLYGDRLQCLRWLKELGYQVGSGNMVGLPHQSIESIADDIISFRDWELDMIGLGPFIPHPETPLRDCTGGTIDLVLRVTALARIVVRTAHIPATTATGTLDPQGRQKALCCGANVLMPNLTPPKYRKHYELYPNKVCIVGKTEEEHLRVEEMITSLGRSVGKGAGHSLRNSS